uniref:EGF-like domain-containing protein n=1 Tax=Biomphalaria glabrata TaxID=6526 RepID=A0A2C9KJI8_BIOGL
MPTEVLSHQVSIAYRGVESPKCNRSSYGVNCTKRCPSNCLKGTCDSITGECFGCIPGYTGDYCDNVCIPTYFGANCRLRCSKQCSQNVCEYKTGKCLSCVPGYTGDFCNIICESSRYGQNCSSSCSLSCIDQLCDRHNGHCLRCNKAVYGKNCDENCSSNCLSESCDVYTGQCVACKPGYVGDFCNKTQNSILQTVAVGVGAAVAAVVLLCLVIGYATYKRKVNQVKLESVPARNDAAISESVDPCDIMRYDNAHDTDSVPDHYERLSEGNPSREANEIHVEMVSLHNQPNKASIEFGDGNVTYQNALSLNLCENSSEQKLSDHVFNN